MRMVLNLVLSPQSNLFSSSWDIRNLLDLLFSVLGISLICHISLKIRLHLRKLLQRKSVDSKSQVFQKYQMYVSTLQTHTEYHALG